MSIELTTEEEVIREAEALSEQTIDQLKRGNMEDNLTAALWELSMHSLDDDRIGNEGDFVARIGQFILLCDGEGFCNSRTYDTLDQAQAAFTYLVRDLGF